ncbi:hypothetical protein [Leptospira stimsonii]|uniref:Flagellar FliJ protein n=1 Tax=Leptospira stimsonii TaxID=2202203 RepID=A0ABY2NFG8_9LEPT|nr:hypothetical protein [Leptospira stimsonii]TGK12825.1 hypothetical protein EHO98_19495 [Leptospira stimsonii]TGM22901.1 hypothetical protein EHQ90_00010 [Leptospira stimsonii]
MNNQDLQMGPLKKLIKYQPRIKGLDVIQKDVSDVCNWLETKREQATRESRSRILANFLRYKARIRYLQNQIIERDLALESEQEENRKLRSEIADMKASYNFKAVG